MVEVEGTAGELKAQWDDIRKVANKKLETLGVEPPAFQSGIEVGYFTGSFLVARYATLHPALSVWQSVHWFVHHT